MFMIQQPSNSRGMFLTITEFYSGKWKGLIIIPGGQNCSGWKDFGLEVRRTLEPCAIPNQRAETRKSAVTETVDKL